MELAPSQEFFACLVDFSQAKHATGPSLAVLVFTLSYGCVVVASNNEPFFCVYQPKLLFDLPAVFFDVFCWVVC